jgi:hypothetical protein
MKTFLTIFIVSLANCVFGQFAIISNKDGFCNVRSSPGIGANIIDSLKRGHFIYCFETTGNWTSIDYSKGKEDLHGQIYKDRVKLISDYQKIPLLTKKENKIILSKDSIKVIISEQKFDKSKYKLTFHKEYKDQLQFINNKQYWGTDGEIPRTEYKSIEIYYGAKKVVLPKNAIDNLFETSLYNTQVNYDKTNDILYIQSMNSDGAGSYEVIWKIEKGIYKERYIAYGF